jgi:dihydrofolate reductase
MARLRYAAITSLDGYVADSDGSFDWAAPSPEVHAFVNDLERSVGTYLYGRRMYDVMVYWESIAATDSPIEADYAEIWRAAEKVVYSTTLEAPSSRRTRVEREFRTDEVRRLVESADRDVSIAGPHLAARALSDGLVDEVALFLVPAIVGGGNRALPDGVRAGLRLTDEHRFEDGTVYLRYDVER